MAENLDDQRLAEAVYIALDALNEAASAAVDAGLRVEYQTTQHQRFGVDVGWQMLNATVLRKVR